MWHLESVYNCAHPNHTNFRMVCMKTYTPRPREWAREQIEAYILEHALTADDLLPPERKMCRMWGLNRCTLRSAISALETAGRLYAVQGSGTRVAPRFRIFRASPNTPRKAASRRKPVCSLFPWLNVIRPSHGVFRGCWETGSIGSPACACWNRCRS